MILAPPNYLAQAEKTLILAQYRLFYRPAKDSLAEEKPDHS